MHYLDVNKYLNKMTEHYQQITNNSKKKDISLEELKKITYDLNVYLSEIKSPLAANKNILYHIINSISNEQYIQYIKNEQILLTGVLPPNLHLFYEDYISDKRDLYKLLKLMSIESLTLGGIKDYNSIKKDILNVYGYQNIFLFRDLEKLGWLRDKSYSKNSINMNYIQLCEKLELVKMDYNNEKPEDSSYVMGGYCPIGLKLIEKGLEGKWNKIQDIIKKIPGEASFPNDESEIYNPTNQINTIFLVFIGGVTYTEIEAVRFLNRKFKENYDKSKSKNPTRKQLIIITTCILGTNKIFSNLGKIFKDSYTFKEFHQQTLNSKKKKK
jgi:lysine-specific histone demethylase 1